MKKAALIAGALALTASVAFPALAATRNSGTSSPVTCTGGGADGTVTVSPDTLWPPNHKMVNVTVSYADTENDGGATGETTMVTITGVSETDGTTTSNAEVPDTLKGSGAPGTVQGPDAVPGATAPGSDPSSPATAQVQLRAERSGTDGHGSGRTYAITVSCMDSNEPGNSTATVDVFVPHDMGQ